MERTPSLVVSVAAPAEPAARRAALEIAAAHIKALIFILIYPFPVFYMSDDLEYVLEPLKTPGSNSV